MKKLLGIIIAAAIVAGGIWYVTNQNAGKQITVLSWDYYIGPNTIADFEKETGATVTYELIKSNEEALARIKANPGVYDIAVVGDYMVDIMRNEKGLEMIDSSMIPNLGNIGAAFKGNYFDPEMESSVPYAFGTTGFAVNTKFHDASTITWAELAKPEYKGKVAVMDDMRFVLGSVLMELGYSPNTTNQTEIDAAVALLKTVVPNIIKFSSDSPVELMVSEGATVAYAWSGDSLQMSAENSTIQYVIPSFGSLKFLDSMVIPAGAPHKDVAHEWINFILRPDVSAAITDEVQYGNPNTAAFDLISEDIRTSPAIFPASDSLTKLQYIEDVGDDVAMYDSAWENIKE
jgi:spermidine/putrescine-binding protein